ncbi:MAG: endonuclease/exonuclease/phosphatase family metal-dependent hydrolase [Myxococcota bacterium]|jgi:endonuclease/exonuclease/phosphatase family metal-dependent hydrolase
MKNNDLVVETYNVLAQCFVEPERYAYVSPPALLQPDVRMKLLLERISASRAHIILLQEVEPELLTAIEAMLGHSHDICYAARPTHSDGCAVLVSRSDAALLAQHTLVYKNHEPGYSQVACIATVRHGANELTVASTHLRCGCQALPGEPPLGQLQMRELLASLSSHTRPCILGGDLNAAPDSPTLHEAYESGFRHAGSHDTAYIRGVRGKRDYLLHTGITLEAFPPDPFLQLPSPQQPSDHVVLRARCDTVSQCR